MLRVSLHRHVAGTGLVEITESASFRDTPVENNKGNRLLNLHCHASFQERTHCDSKAAYASPDERTSFIDPCLLRLPSPTVAERFLGDKGMDRSLKALCYGSKNLGKDHLGTEAKQRMYSLNKNFGDTESGEFCNR